MSNKFEENINPLIKVKSKECVKNKKLVVIHELKEIEKRFQFILGQEGEGFTLPECQDILFTLER